MEESAPRARRRAAGADDAPERTGRDGGGRRHHHRPAAGTLLQLVLAALLLLLAGANAPVAGAQHVALGGRAVAAGPSEGVEPEGQGAVVVEEDTTADVGADGARIARWRKHKHLNPCVGCTEGQAMRLDGMFRECSLFTFGQNMGVYPSQTNLTLQTNETVLVHLVGSRLYFPESQAFFDLMGSLMRNSTCPAPTDADVEPRLRNITALCAVADPAAGGALVGGVRLQGEEEEGPLCVIYPVQGESVDAQGLGLADHAAGLYGPGTYGFNFSGFRTEEFRYAFWSVQFLQLPPDGGDDVDAGAVLRANVTSKGAFVNNPPALPKPMLVNAFFIAAIAACAIFFAVYNPEVGNRLVDLGSRSPFLRRHVFEQRHTGPIPQPAAAPTLPVMPRRQLSWNVSVGVGRSGGTNYTLMEDGNEEEGSP